MRKKLHFILITIIIAALLTACSSGTGGKTPIDETPTATGKANPKGLEIYLVQEKSSSANDNKTDVNEYELEEEPLLSESDILSYNWQTHCIELKNNGNIDRDLLRRQFVVMADGERIYSGAFWSNIFSMIPPTISIYIDNMHVNDNTIVLALDSWRPGEAISTDTEKTLADDRILKVLQRDNQLYIAYKPEHFERPDSISVWEHNTQRAYGDLDWEKIDHLLQLLDQRFEYDLDFVKLDLSNEEGELFREDETIVILEYDPQRELEFKLNGADKKIVCRELIMPVTGQYGDLMFFRGDNGLTSPLGRLKKFTDFELLEGNDQEP